MPKYTRPDRLEVQRTLRWVPLGKMRVSSQAQRERSEAWVDHLLAEFDPEQYSPPVVNLREDEGHYYILDGQHSTEAFRRWIGEGWENQQVQAWVYTGLTEEQEAEVFLKLNTVKAVNAYEKFRVGVTAGRPVETAITKIVQSCDLKISMDKGEGTIRAVGTLVKVYERSGGSVLRRALSIIRDSYGSAGFEAAVIDGIAHVCARYEASLDDEKAVKQLSTAHGGVKGLLNAAENLRQMTGNPKAHCVAAAAVNIYNRGRGGSGKLPSWWKGQAA